MKCSICSNELKELILGNNNMLMQCSVCSHIFRDINKCEAFARKHPWGGNSTFDKVRLSLVFFDLFRFIRKKEKSINILEIGFGTGYLINKLINKGFYNIYGVEKYLLEKDIFNGIIDKIKIYKQDLVNIEFDRKFELVYAVHVIEHISDFKSFFKKLGNIVEKNGLLFFITPNATSLGLKIFKEYWWNLEDPTHCHFFSPKSIKKCLDENGFDCLKISFPWWESVTIEVNSFLRFFNKKKLKNGVMESKFNIILSILLLPFFILLRFFIPSIRPSMLIIAKKR